MKKIFTFLFLTINTISFAQLENANWCFRNLAGVNFNSTPNPTASNSSIAFPLPSGASGVNAASVSDKFGNLLFYTNGRTVWDKNHIPMPNGTGIYGGSSEAWDQQGLIIVPKPNSETLYYIFSAYASPSPGNNYHVGFYYSVVDMDPLINGGNGDIIPGQKNIPLNNPAGIQIDYEWVNNTGQLIIIDKRITSTLNSNGDKV